MGLAVRTVASGGESNMAAGQEKSPQVYTEELYFF